MRFMFLPVAALVAAALLGVPGAAMAAGPPATPVAPAYVPATRTVAPAYAGVASQAGALELNAAPAQLNSWDKVHIGSDQDGGGGYAVTGTSFSLSTTGKPGVSAEIESPGSYAYGVFEAKLGFSGDGSKVADWPAFWADGADWPQDGEIDAAEAGSGYIAAHYHYGTGADPESVNSPDSDLGPGWHIVDVVWSPGRIEIWYDGKLFYTFSGSYVSGQPERLLLDITSGWDNAPDRFQTSYVRVWGLK